MYIANAEILWKTASFTYEGFPLLLRCPDGLNYDLLARSYKYLVTLEHTLDKVMNNGLPVYEYNESLNDFDDAVTCYFENRGAGISVLVETFGGRRIYYMYTSHADNALKLEKNIQRLYPNTRICVSIKKDATFSFIKKYAEEWGF